VKNTSDEEARERAQPTPTETGRQTDGVLSYVIKPLLVGIFAVVGISVMTNSPGWFRGTHWFEGTVTVQQVREMKGVTRIWMNDGTVWESVDPDALLLMNSDEIRYQHVTSSEIELRARSTYDAAAINPTYSYDEVCYLVEKSRPGLLPVIAMRIVADPKRESCPGESILGYNKANRRFVASTVFR